MEKILWHIWRRDFQIIADTEPGELGKLVYSGTKDLGCLPGDCEIFLLPATEVSVRVYISNSAIELFKGWKSILNFKGMDDWKCARGFRIYCLENAVSSGQGTALKTDGKHD